MDTPDTEPDGGADGGADPDPMSPAGHARHGVLRRAVDWLFVDRTTGGYTVAQWPNVALWLFIASVLAVRIFHPSGAVGSVLRVVEDGAILWWAGDELLRGVNPFRRILGLVIGAATVLGIISQLL